MEVNAFVFHYLLVISNICQYPDSLALLLRAQNAAIIVRRRRHMTRFELFEVSAPSEVCLALRAVRYP